MTLLTWQSPQVDLSRGKGEPGSESGVAAGVSVGADGRQSLKLILEQRLGIVRTGWLASSDRRNPFYPPKPSASAPHNTHPLAEDKAASHGRHSRLEKVRES